MDLRKIVVDRMTELDLTVRDLSAKSEVAYTTLADFCRDPKDYKAYTDQKAKKRAGNLNSAALAAVFDALDIQVVAKPNKKK